MTVEMPVLVLCLLLREDRKAHPMTECGKVNNPPTLRVSTICKVPVGIGTQGPRGLLQGPGDSTAVCDQNCHIVWEHAPTVPSRGSWVPFG